MKAMILAAGRGERMRPLTDQCPKPLLAVAGKPLIVHHIERLRQAGFVELVINHAWLGKQIEATLGDGSAWGVTIDYSAEEAGGLETAGGIHRALPLLGDEPFLVVNGDVYTDIDFRSLALADEDQAHLVLVNNPPQHPQGDFLLRAGRVTSDGANRLTYSGVGLYRPAMFERIPEPKYPLAPLLRQAMEQGRVSGQHHTGVWHDIGTPERLQALNQSLNTEA